MRRPLSKRTKSTVAAFRRRIGRIARAWDFLFAGWAERLDRLGLARPERTLRARGTRLKLVPLEARFMPSVDTLINFYTTDAQVHPAVASDAAGDFVVAWASYGQDGDGYGIFAREYLADGTPWGCEFQVNTNTTGDQTSPAVGMDADGNFVVAWTGVNTSGLPNSLTEVYLQNYAADGTPVGMEYQVNGYTTLYQFDPSVGMNASGQFVVSWTSLSEDGSDYGVYARQFDAGGTPVAVEFAVNTYTFYKQDTSSAAMAANGDFVIAWASARQENPPVEETGVYAQKFNADGSPDGGEIHLSTYTTHNQSNPSIAVDGSGGFIVAWDGEGLADGDGIYVSFSGGSASLANTTTTGSQSNPSVAADASGNFIVTWMSYAQDGDASGVYAQRFAANGSTIGSEFRVNATTAGGQEYPAATMDAAGDFVVAWDGTGPGDTGGVFFAWANGMPFVAPPTECGCSGGDLGVIAPGADGGVPTMLGGASVRYADGSIAIPETDLTTDAFGTGWGQSRMWTNGAGYAPLSTNGVGVVDTQQPFLLADPTDNTLVVVRDKLRADYYDLVSSTWVERFYGLDTLTYGSGVYTLTDTRGGVTQFYDFSDALPAAQRGRLLGYADADGNAVAVSYTGDGLVDEVTRSGPVGGSTVYESLLYAYTSGGTPQISTVTLRRKVGAGSYATVRSVAYTYYDCGDTHGNLGDLKLVEVKDAGGTTLTTDYYRYYTPGESGGYVHGLKYAFQGAAYDLLTAALGTSVDTLTDAQVDDYADLAITYDSARRVTEVVARGAGCSCTAGGFGTYSYAYTASANTPGFNSWAMKTVETLPDGTTNTVYTNAYGEVMLTDVTASGQDWVSYTEYDSSGRAILTASPSAVTGYSDAYDDLVHFSAGNASYLADSAGTLTAYTYAGSTTATSSVAGDAAGYVKEIDLVYGETGTAVPQSSQTYIQRTDGNGAIYYFPAGSTVYRNDNGTGGETTTTTYTWQGSTARPDQITVTLPTVTTGQNGPNSATSMVTAFDSYGRPIWTKDAAGFLTYTEYDNATGAVTKQITDVDTTQTGTFSDKPSGWSTPGGGGLHLTTTYEVDDLGRTTKVTAPNGRVDYTVYNDADHEDRYYPGWNAGTDLPTGPITVTREDRENGYSETLTMSATPTVSSDRPTGAESIGGLQSLSRSYTNTAGRVVYDDEYFYLTGLSYSTAANIGTQNTNFYRTEYGYADNGQVDRTETPQGTITRTVYDGLGRAVSEWVGTDDTPTTGYWSPTNTAGTDLVEVSENEYDGGGVGDGNLTATIEHPGLSQADRETDYFYDWRDRQVAVKVGVESSESTSVNRPISYTDYDNLGEVTKTRTYDGDTVSISFTSGVPNAPSSSLLRSQSTSSYDELGRVYLSQVYSVDPSNGSVGSYTLDTNTWYDARGNVIKESQPGGLVQKMVYDGAGRVTTSYTTDGGGDSGYSDADDVTGDAVLDQVETAYDESGNVLATTTRERFHDETGTGALGTVSSGVHARVSYVAYYYDAADRLIETADYGTYGGNAWTRPSTPPTQVYETFTIYETASTQGSWHGVYGSDGYELSGGFGTSLPSYAQVTITGATSYTWTSSTSDSKGLQKPSPSSDRFAAQWYNATAFDVDVNLTDGKAHQVSFYLQDWDNGGRDTLIEVIDAATGTVLDSEDANDQYWGAWLGWEVSGHVLFRFFNQNLTYNATLSGIFFDPAGATPETVLVSTTAFDAAGRVAQTVDPKGIVDKSYYDALGRTTKTIENYDDGTVSDSDDKTTEYTYNAAGMTTLKADLTAGGSETTEWVYGITTGGGNGLNSNDVVGITKWPDPSTGAASASEEDLVTVDALGETKTATDRNGNVHTLSYDALGRVTADAVTTLGSGVDGSIRRIETAYDGQGNAYLVTSYDAYTSGSIVNQVQDVFNGLGQLVTEYQSHSGAVNTSTTPKVQYAYSEMPSGANHSRLTSMTDPNGRVITYDYGTGSALNDTISRLEAIKDGGTTMEGYAYLGLGTVVLMTHPETGVDLTYIKQSGETDGEAGDQYIGLDRFGRIVDQRWVNGTPTDLDRYQYAYDADGNVLYRINHVQTNGTLNELYGYDGLGQLTSFARGEFNDDNTKIKGTVYRSQDFDFDAIGNWESLDTDGTPVSRTNDKQNELTGIGGATLTYDANGNQTTDETGLQFVWDAWNRLVTVKNGGGSTIETNAYDGRNFRVSSTASGPPPHSPTPLRNWLREGEYYKKSYQHLGYARP